MLRRFYAAAKELRQPVTARGVIYLLVGGLLALVPYPLFNALIAVGVPAVAAYGLALLPAVLCGFVSPARALARRSAAWGLRVTIPPPVEREVPERPYRRMLGLHSGYEPWRFVLWLLLHAVVGAQALVFLSATLASGVVLTGLVLDEGVYGALNALMADGWRASALLALLPLGLVLTYFYSSLGTQILVSLAPPLLGPWPEELVNALFRRNDRLVELNRLTTELHNSVGRTLTRIHARADLALGQVGQDAGEARARALAEIRDEALRATAGLDDMLRAMSDESSAREQADLADLDVLLNRMRSVGIRVEASVSGDLDLVPPPVGREAMAALEEGYHNVLKHARSAPTKVCVSVHDRDLSVTVMNGPHSAPPPYDFEAKCGSGISAMRERVARLGGRVEAGPTEAGGYRLHVFLPIPSETE